MKRTSNPSILAATALAMSMASLVIAGCTSSTSDDGANGANGNGGSVETDESAASTDDEIRASCNSPRRYFVTYADGRACAPIPGRRGRWLPEKLFADAPDEVQSATCAYRWSGAKYSRADGDALKASVGLTGGVAPACGDSSEPEIGLLEQIPYVDNWTQAGSVGCDVCGVLRRGRIWVILPPEKIALKQFEVQLSNGETRAFQIQGTRAGAVSVTLPPPPAGTSYKQGRVHVY